MAVYDFKSIEQKWQDKWATDERLKAVEDEISDLTNEIEKYKQQLKQVQKAIQDEDELTARLQEEIAKLEGGDAEQAE